MRGFHGARLALLSDDEVLDNTSPVLSLASYSADGSPRKTIDTGHSRSERPSLSQTLLKAADRLLAEQNPAGTWTLRRAGDPGLRARLLLCLYALGYDQGDRADRLAERLLAEQTPTGGWSRQPGGPVDLSISVLAYLAIKLRQGLKALPALRDSRRAILSLGGSSRVQDEPHAWLVLFGQAAPRESHLDAAWSSVLSASNDLMPDALHGIRELFTTTDQNDAGRELTEAIPTSVESLWARLSLLGSKDSSEISAAEEAIESFIHDDHKSGEIDYSPSLPADLDAAPAIETLSNLGYFDEAAHAAAALARHAIDRPDHLTVCTTAQVLQALQAWSTQEPAHLAELPPSLKVCSSDAVESEAAQEEFVEVVEPAIIELRRLLVEQQELNGSWNDVETTSRAIKTLKPSEHELTDQETEAVNRGVAYLRSRQLADGSWPDSPASDPYVTTSQAVLALSCAITPTEAKEDAAVQAGVNWLLAEQKDDGGWSHPPHLADESDGKSAVVPTAHALEAIIVTGIANTDAARDAVDLLLSSQDDSGAWGNPSSEAGLHSMATAVRSLARWAVVANDPPPISTPVCLRVVVADTVAS